MSVPHPLLDRAAATRKDDALLDSLWHGGRSRVVLVRSGAVAVLDGSGGADPGRPDGIGLPASALPAAPVPGRIFLGLGPEGEPWWCIPIPAGERGGAGADLIPGLAWPSLRELGPALTALDWEVLSTAVALESWHARHRFCPACGAPTAPVSGGWVRRCTNDGSEHYPRTDPAVIVLVIDRDDRALLARQRRWPPAWRSTLAGFVEPGEPAETAVRREVAEEVGLALDGVRYVSSQPWPFPGSLMIGFHADAATTAIEVDGDEIAEAQWYTRDQLAQAAASGAIALPPSISIARRLVERWYGAALPGGWLRR
jgi:NAD+ diphosphatase